MIYLITILILIYFYYIFKNAIQKDNNKINDNLKKFKDGY